MPPPRSARQPPPGKGGAASAPKSRLIRAQKDHDPYTWSEVECEAYKQGQEAGREWKGIVRQVLVGKQAEATSFHLRYFEIEPGGYSSLEKHAHAHVVIAVRGQGRVILNDQARKMQTLDTVYVAPWTPHQFLADGDEPFGFFCIVDAERDHPQAVAQQEGRLAQAVGALPTVPLPRGDRTGTESLAVLKRELE